ncbi:MAG: hypothetical protein P4L27_01465 [Ignavibacteriaceae bacterium]|nr:hypothetical protein [Ignavibacteriaceae bacterium]
MNYNSGFLRNLYDNSFPAFRNLMTSFYGLYKNRSDHGKYYTAYLNLLRKSQYWSNDKLEEYSQAQLNEFINTIHNSSFYRDKVYSGEFREFPLINKGIVRSRIKEIYSDKVKITRHKLSHTSGTTGSAIIFPLSMKCYQRDIAFRTLAYNWAEVYPGKDKIAHCSGHVVTPAQHDAPPFWTYDYWSKQLYMSSYHMSQNNLKYYLEELEKFQAEVIHGYPSSIYLLALAYKSQSSRKLKLKAIFTSSETLMPLQRAIIEGAFQAKVYNYYGNTEMTSNIVECEKGELHLKHEYSYVEILNDANEKCKPGERGKIVSTNFSNELFPLVRYEIGDYVTVSPNQNSLCGRGGLLIEKIEGRDEDYIVTGEGRLVGRLDHIFKDSINIINAQIYQKIPGEVILRIVKNDKYSSKDENDIHGEATKRLGLNTKIIFEYVAEIERSSNGKFRFINSELDLNKYRDTYSIG